MLHAIYGIIINNKIYVGSAINVFKRFNNHQYRLSLNIHPNQHLQNAWNKYNHCIFDILEEVENKQNLLEREEHYIEKFKSYNRDFGYNKRRKPNNNLGLKLPQTKERIEHRASLLRGRKLSIETIEKIRLSQLGKKQSEESKIKKSLATIGIPKSEEHKKKIGKGNRKLNKWPHDDGAWCKCRECLDKKNLKSKEYPSYKRKLKRIF